MLGAGQEPPELRPRTGWILTVSGAIAAFAVHWQPSFLDLHTAGLILLLTGLGWLWIPVRGKRALLHRQLDATLAYLDHGRPGADTRHAPLADLLTTTPPPAGAAPAGMERAGPGG